MRTAEGNAVSVTGRPVVFAHGYGCDQSVRRNLPGSTLVAMNATGHCPNLSAPAETIAAIRAFL